MQYVLTIVAVNPNYGYNINTYTYNYTKYVQETTLISKYSKNKDLIIKIIKNIALYNNNVNPDYATLLQKLINLL